MISLSPNNERLMTYSQTKVGTFATAAALVAIAPVRDGTAILKISDA
jgi:hypothetical protein